MSELYDKRVQLAWSISFLLDMAKRLGYEVTIGEVTRDKRIAELNAAEGRGISNSLHLDGLAIDINLFKKKKYLGKTEDHQILGEYWESLGPDHRWGGRFGDGNHYSIEYKGRK